MAEFPNHFETREEAEFRLKNTVVTYDNQPAYVHKIRDGFPDGVFRVFISMLPIDVEGGPIPEDAEDDPEDGVPAGRILRKKINSPKFNRFRPFRMGYANIFNPDQDGIRHPRLLTRIPVRKSTQGLCPNALAATSPTAGIPRGGAGLRFNSIIAAEGFAEMVRGEYPSMEEVLDTVEEDSAIAFDRDCAIARDNLGIDYLWHGPQKIGIIRRGEALLGPKFSYLIEKLRSIPSLHANIGTL